MPYSRVESSVVNVCRIREPDGGGVSIAFFRGLPDRPGTYGNAAAYVYPAAYVCASGSAAPNDPANSDAAPVSRANSDAAPNDRANGAAAAYACANGAAAAYACAKGDTIPDARANGDAAPARRANFGFHTQHPKRPVG